VGGGWPGGGRSSLNSLLFQGGEEELARKKAPKKKKRIGVVCTHPSLLWREEGERPVFRKETKVFSQERKKMTPSCRVRMKRSRQERRAPSKKGGGGAERIQFRDGNTNVRKKKNGLFRSSLCQRGGEGGERREALRTASKRGGSKKKRGERARG